MKVKELASEPLSKEFSVTVPANDISKRVDAQLQQVGQRVKMPGFRPGKIPMAMLKQRYGQSVMGEVLEKTVNETSQKALDDRKVKAAMPPKIEIVKFEDGKDLEYKMKVELMPDLPKIDTKKISLERPVYELSDKEIDEALNRLAERQKGFDAQAKDYKAKKGDAVKIDFKGFKSGEAFAGGAAQGHTLELGSNSFIPGFEEQLIGSKAGDEKTVKVTFPKEYHSKDLAGADAEFKVTIHEVLKSAPAKVDEDFAKNIGMENLQGLRDAVRGSMEQEYNEAVRARLKKQLFDQLDEAYRFDVPGGMVDMEFDAIWQRVQEAKKEGDASLQGKSEKELEKEYRQIAERRVRLGLLLAEVAKQGKIEVTQAELSRAVMQQARQYPGQEQKVFEHYQQHPQALDALRGPILEDKAVDLLLKEAKTTDKKYTTEQLMAEEDEASAKPARKTAAKKPAASEEKKAAPKKSTAKPGGAKSKKKG